MPAETRAIAPAAQRFHPVKDAVGLVHDKEIEVRALCDQRRCSLFRDTEAAGMKIAAVALKEASTCANCGGSVEAFLLTALSHLVPGYPGMSHSNRRLECK